MGHDERRGRARVDTRPIAVDSAPKRRQGNEARDRGGAAVAPADIQLPRRSPRQRRRRDAGQVAPEVGGRRGERGSDHERGGRACASGLYAGLCRRLASQRPGGLRCGARRPRGARVGVWPAAPPAAAHGRGRAAGGLRGRPRSRGRPACHCPRRPGSQWRERRLSTAERGDAAAASGACGECAAAPARRHRSASCSHGNVSVERSGHARRSARHQGAARAKARARSAQGQAKPPAQTGRAARRQPVAQGAPEQASPAHDALARAVRVRGAKVEARTRHAEAVRGGRHCGDAALPGRARAALTFDQALR
mmetsp:Transcript_12155/g.20751  ORF Transcript_12155/g.20751 Transcript_12155/m.20751 type:complete len:309 (+) Transcript_12155:577-1503(+)